VVFVVVVFVGEYGDGVCVEFGGGLEGVDGDLVVVGD